MEVSVFGKSSVFQRGETKQCGKSGNIETILLLSKPYTFDARAHCLVSTTMEVSIFGKSSVFQQGEIEQGGKSGNIETILLLSKSYTVDGGVQVLRLFLVPQIEVQEHGGRSPLASVTTFTGLDLLDHRHHEVQPWSEVSLLVGAREGAIEG